MSSISELKKVAKKQKRCQLILSNETGIKFCDNPEKVCISLNKKVRLCFHKFLFIKEYCNM